METVECGGFAGIQCPRSDMVCIDNPNDDCIPDCGGSDCIGICVLLNGQSCTSDSDCNGKHYKCVDADGDACHPYCRGEDCPGVCAKTVYR